MSHLLPSLPKALLAPALLLAAFAMTAPETADAGYRQYYSSWSYHPTHSYHYRTYYYRPAPRVTTYSTHYVVYRPSTPRYVYYYNPVRRVYWGRYDTEQNGYSLLAEKDRKEHLKDIPESAFPEPGEMPTLDDTEDGLKLQAPPSDKPEDPAPTLPDGQ